MEIRKRAELDVLYPEPQKGIMYESPELLLMQYISENKMDKWEETRRMGEILAGNEILSFHLEMFCLSR